jgi:hypothetical protein
MAATTLTSQYGSSNPSTVVAPVESLKHISLTESEDVPIKLTSAISGLFVHVDTSQTLCLTISAALPFENEDEEFWWNEVG